MNLLSIFNFVCSTLRQEVCPNHEDGFIYSARFTEPITYEELKNRIDKSIKDGKYWINQLFTITSNEGLVAMPDLSYAAYSSRLEDILFGNVPIESIADPEERKYYDMKYKAIPMKIPARCIFKRFISRQDPTYFKYWTNTVNFNKRLETYYYNLKILNNYLKNKK